LASIFKKAGHIKHVSIPKYNNSKLGKGFAFIEYKSEEEAKAAVENLNNFVPEELWNSSLENYIPVCGPITPLRVILKTTWLKMKDEMKSIKNELAALNPEIMFQPNAQ
jgi:RNA recognition motif-containing protein